MPGIGTVTTLAKQRNALPFPSKPYAGSPTPGATPGQSYLPAAPTTSPSTVSQALSNTNQTLDTAKADLGSTQPFLDNYLKPNAAGTTPFRQALTNTKASDTATAYDSAVTNIRNKSAAMGFSDSSQPVTFGAEAGLANNRAKAIADIPNQVNLQAQPVEFQAAQMQQNQSSLQNAIANTQQGQASILAQQKAAQDAQKAALTSGLATAGITAGAPILAHALHIGGAAAGAGAGAAAGAGTAAAADASIAAGGAPLAISGVGGGAATGLSGALGLGGSSGFLGIGAATIPVIGGIIAGGVLLANHFIGEGRKAADKLTGEGGIQHAFEDTLNTIDSAPGQTEAQKWQAKEQAYQKLVELGTQFAQKGDNERLVATQMFDEISHLFGQPNPLTGRGSADDIQILDREALDMGGTGAA